MATFKVPLLPPHPRVIHATIFSHFPRKTPIMWDTAISALCAKLWRKHFMPGREGPTARVLKGKPSIQAAATKEGVFINVTSVMRQAKKTRRTFVSNLLKHELMHWAGYGHTPTMKRLLKKIGGTT